MDSDQPRLAAIVCLNAPRLRNDIESDAEFAHISADQLDRQFQTGDTPEDLGHTLLHILICGPYQPHPPDSEEAYQGMLDAARACLRAIYC